MGLALVGFSSLEANKTSLFSIVSGGGLLGFGALDRRCVTASGVGGGVLCGVGPVLAIGGAGAGAAINADGIRGALGTGFLVPGGAEGSLCGTS